MNIDDLIEKDYWDIPEAVESMRGIAKMTRIKYDELIKQGFDKDQALELCKNLFSTDYKS